MRFKLPAPAQLTWIPVTIWLIKTLVVGFENELGKYIHPRFFTFTLAATIFGLGVLHISQALPEHQPEHTESPNPIWFSIIVLASLATAMMPPISLSAASVINRGNESYAAAPVKLSARYDQFNIREWSSLLAQSNDPLTVIGKPVSIEGFISELPQADAPGKISRFSVTCCAIDAQPISLPIASPQLQAFSVNEWVRIRGTWQRDATSDKGTTIVISDIAHIDQPKEPYVY